MLTRLRRQPSIPAIEKALPDALDHLARLLRSGLGLSTALERLLEDLEGPLYTIFRQIIDDHHHGRAIEQGFRELRRRYPGSSFELVLAAFELHRETGGQLAKLLNQVAKTLREGQLLDAELSAYTAEARLSAWILSALPLGVFALDLAFKPQEIATLYLNPLGSLLLYGAVGALALGMVMTLATLRRLKAAI